MIFILFFEILTSIHFTGFHLLCTNKMANEFFIHSSKTPMSCTKFVQRVRHLFRRSSSCPDREDGNNETTATPKNGTCKDQYAILSILYEYII